MRVQCAARGAKARERRGEGWPRRNVRHAERWGELWVENWPDAVRSRLAGSRRPGPRRPAPG
ncbi:hypothetical protein AMK27_19895 [Streptomyces sp. CB02009]|nr:hypothetical protein AMK27_19895 [Streptomyces sp. CB02009]